MGAASCYLGEEQSQQTMDNVVKYQDDKALIKDAVKLGKIPMTTSWTLEDFLAAVTEDDTFKGISSINIKIIYDDQIERLREKELKEAKKRQRLGEIFLDLLYAIFTPGPPPPWIRAGSSRPLLPPHIGPLPPGLARRCVPTSSRTASYQNAIARIWPLLLGAALDLATRAVSRLPAVEQGRP